MWIASQMAVAVVVSTGGWATSWRKDLRLKGASHLRVNRKFYVPLVGLWAMQWI